MGLKYLWCIEYVDASEDDVVDDDSLNPYESLDKIVMTRPRTKYGLGLNWHVPIPVSNRKRFENSALCIRNKEADGYSKQGRE